MTETRQGRSRKNVQHRLLGTVAVIIQLQSVLGLDKDKETIQYNTPRRHVQSTACRAHTIQKELG